MLEIDKLILRKIIDSGEKGVTYLDFPDNPEVNEKSLAESIQRITDGVFKAPLQKLPKLDS